MYDKLDLQIFGEMEDVAADKCKEVFEDYPGNDVKGTHALVALAQMMAQNDSLERIAEALESIDERLSKLASCVTERDNFCIAGEVTTYKP